jgi:hypothetical protein
MTEEVSDRVLILAERFRRLYENETTKAHRLQKAVQQYHKELKKAVQQQSEALETLDSVTAHEPLDQHAYVIAWERMASAIIDVYSVMEAIER